MHVDFTATVLGCLYELNCIVEYTLDILLHMVFQKVAPVFDSLVLKVVFAVISCAVNNVGDAQISQH